MSQQDLTRAPHTDPLNIYRYRDGLYAVDLLGAALVWLDFFTWLGEHPSDKAAICRALEITERPTDVMLTLFTAMGLVRARDGVFSLTESAREHLVKSSPWFMGPYYASLKDRPVCKDYVNVLRTGQPANWGSLKNEKDWARAMEDEAFAQSFTAAMDCRGVYLGQAMARLLDLRGHTHLLDVAGGSGIYACSLVARHPHLRATVLEKPPVDRVAAAAIAKRGYAERVSVRVKGKARENVSDAPALDTQSRPSRPRPRVCSSATSRQACRSCWRRPCGVRGSRERTSISPGRDTRASCWPLLTRARSSSRVLVESTLASTSTVMPGSSGSSCSHSAVAPQLGWCRISVMQPCPASAPAWCAGSSGCRSGTRNPS